VTPLLHLDQWAGAVSASSEAVRVEKWQLLRRLHAVVYESPAPAKPAAAKAAKAAAAGAAATGAASEPAAKSNPRGGAEVATTAAVGRRRVDGELLRASADTAASYRGVSVEGCLWRQAGTDGRVGPDVFVGALVGVNTRYIAVSPFTPKHAKR
jgi:pyruvate/2-oxoglutarate dehydrogenase complex dihydrolipoamide acyltransferase (E2) component